MSEQATDRQIVERVQNGDKDAYGLLVTKYQRKVAKLVAGYVKNSGDAADVTQETFIKAYRSLASFRGESAFYTWLYRIAINTSKNYITAQARRVSTKDFESDAVDGSYSSDALRDSATPERVLLSNEIKQVIFNAMQALPEELRVAITLRELEGMSYDEIAVVMDSPVGTVRSRIFRARDTIDRAIRPLLQK